MGAFEIAKRMTPAQVQALRLIARHPGVWPRGFGFRHKTLAVLIRLNVATRARDNWFTTETGIAVLAELEAMGR